MNADSAPSDTFTARRAFSHELVVEDEHVDRFGHANNVVVVRWIQDVAEAHSTAVGFPVAAYERLGAGFIVRRHEVDYLRPSFRGDRLVVRTWIESAKSASCGRATEISSAEDGRLMVTAMTTWVYADIANMRLARIPDDVRLAFGFEARRSGGTSTTA